MEIGIWNIENSFKNSILESILFWKKLVELVVELPYLFTELVIYLIRLLSELKIECVIE